MFLLTGQLSNIFRILMLPCCLRERPSCIGNLMFNAAPYSNNHSRLDAMTKITKRVDEQR